MTVAQFQRHRLGLSAKATGILADLSLAEVTLIETGRLRPTERQLNKLAKALHVSVPATLLQEARLTDSQHLALEPGGGVGVNPATVHPNARLLSIDQAAAESGISTGTLRRLINEGELSTVRIPGNRRILIDRAELVKRIEKTWREVAS